IQSIAGRSFVDGRPLAEARQVFADRVAALARVHSALLDSRWSGASLDEIVRGELAPFGGRASIVGPPLQVQPQMAQHLAMALHELATNATKHGALSTPGGSVRVEWTTRVADGESLFAFAWSETGGPPVLPPSREGFGQTLLRRILASTIAAQPAIDYAPEGLRYSFECPLSRVAVDGRTA
ncbi:MAG TPA: sensor histidine kinase, partial [Beijerinckiaceae bacterium]